MPLLQQAASGGGAGTIIARSQDGTNWSTLKGPNWIRSIAFGDGRFVTVDPYHFLTFTSVDLTNWVQATLKLGDIGYNDAKSLAFIEGKFFVFGSTMRTQVSSNGTEWAEMNISAAGVAGSPKGLVAVDGGTLYSTNGLNWIRTVSPSGGLSSVAYGAGLYVASGRNGTILVSHDGKTWNRRSAFTQTWIDPIAYGSDSFVGFSTGDPLIIRSAVTHLKIEASGGSGAFLHVPASSASEDLEISRDFLNWSVLRSFPNGTYGEELELDVNESSAFQRVRW